MVKMIKRGRIPEPVTSAVLNRVFKFAVNNRLIRAAVKPFAEAVHQRIVQLKKQVYGFIVW